MLYTVVSCVLRDTADVEYLAQRKSKRVQLRGGGGLLVTVRTRLEFAEKLMDLEELHAALTRHEPSEYRGYLMVPRGGQTYTPGSGVPTIGAAKISQSGGLLRVGEPSGVAPIEFLGVYLTLDEYAPLDVDPTARNVLVEHFISQVPKTELLVALAILNRAIHNHKLRFQLMTEFAAFLRPEPRERFENLVSPAVREDPRWFLARQPVLLSMREVLARPLVSEQSHQMEPLVAAILLVHSVAMGLNSERRENEELLGRHPASLAMEICQNQLFHAGEDTYALLDRHVRLWREFGDQVDDPTPRLLPVNHLAEATGTDLITVLSAGFALWANVSAWKPGNPFIIRKPLAPGLAQAEEEAVLGIIARTLSQFRGAVAEGARSSWDLLVFQQSPVLDLGHSLVVLDEDFLLDRVTTGLYWEVHDYEKGRSDRDRRRWTQVYGEMVELQMEESIDCLAPPSLGGAPTSYSEEDLGVAYPGKRTDRVVDRGDTFLLVEVVSGRLTVPSRVEGDVDAFRNDTEKLILKKVRQLNEAGRVLAEDRGAALTGFERETMPRMLPVIVVAGGFGGYPINPVTVEFVNELIEQEGLLSDSYFDDLCVLDIGEVELLEGLVERGRDPTELLREWKKSSLWRMSFNTWVTGTIGPQGPSFRPERMSSHVERVFAEIQTRLDLNAEG